MEALHNKNRWIGYIIIALSYAAAMELGIQVFLKLEGALWYRILAGDVAATLLIWILSLLLQNASLYDPYWSVQPVVILTLLLRMYGRYDAGSVFICAVILFWGIRLTANWAYTFDGLGSQDWRYDQLKNQTGRLFQLVNLTGIQLMPTFIVYLCILPAVYFMEWNSTFTARNLFGIIVSAAGALLQMTADAQMHRFRKNNTDRSKINRNGLWKYSRHPNYLGEILMWWGVYLTFAASHAGEWCFGIGAFVNTLLFLFISIPLAEKHLAGYKEGFEQYCSETRKLLPLPRVSQLFVKND